MTIKATYADLNEIPEQYRDLFIERNGQYELSGIEGVKTEADVSRLQTALAKERAEHKTAKERLSVWDGLDPDEVRGQLDRLPELESLAQGKLDDEKINQLVEARLNIKLGPVERERAKLAEVLKERDATLAEYEAKDRQRMIHEAVRKAATESKVKPEAYDDVLLWADRIFEINETGSVTAKDNVGCTPGIDPSAWFSEIQGKKAYWWPDSQGGGATGNNSGAGPANPWKKDSYNVTEQMKISAADPAAAKRLMQAAGIAPPPEL